MQRSLQQVAGPEGSAEHEGVTYVTTPEELREAVSAGARHILITEHLNLTTLQIPPISSLPTMLGISNSTWTIRVCASPVCCVCNVGSCALLACMLSCTNLSPQEHARPCTFIEWHDLLGQ
jgi:hypothetical protein